MAYSSPATRSTVGSIVKVLFATERVPSGSGPGREMTISPGLVRLLIVTSPVVPRARNSLKDATRLPVVRTLTSPLLGLVEMRVGGTSTATRPSVSPLTTKLSSKMAMSIGPPSKVAPLMRVASQSMPGMTSRPVQSDTMLRPPSSAVSYTHLTLPTKRIV